MAAWHSITDPPTHPFTAVHSRQLANPPQFIHKFTHRSSVRGPPSRHPHLKENEEAEAMIQGSGSRGREMKTEIEKNNGRRKRRERERKKNGLTARVTMTMSHALMAIMVRLRFAGMAGSLLL